MLLGEIKAIGTRGLTVICTVVGGLGAQVLTTYRETVYTVSCPSVRCLKVCCGFCIVEVGLPSPKFHKKLAPVEAAVVLVKLTVRFPQPCV